MRNRYFLVLFTLLFSFSAFAEGGTILKKKTEHLKYVIHYGFIRGGKASLKLKSERYKGQDVHHLILSGHTTGLTNSLFGVKNTYESFVDRESLLPIKAIRDIKEGNYKRYNELIFDRENNKVYSKRSGEHDVVEGVHDILSAFYFARMKLFNSDLVEGQDLKIDTYFSDEPFLLQFKFMGYETINSKIGKIKCYKFIPVVETGRAFKNKDDMHIWISADENKVPVRVQFDLFIGSLRCDLVNFPHTTVDPGDL
ncbi:DUF3108 domain-containing protein [Ancylomarina euxinus]|uniref:DUF3108 domain-containing protein n=1 Tax=Ancylomarina euxinus TaxID=2283627 RepID=A0A425Y854_9BACT|nr:DUF3108 domain-containing protein [Ancylomarina euxinus]MCZ4693401.1 DUF3108 domain-containing protein [Ancylomarina euxinus]MUP13628.1 DUF3108 domain-containing protein [Ancylomarina euxinus]RRG24729.1 DUF3108 domain-containing protein [Ancylomarina euxinus]